MEELEYCFFDDCRKVAKSTWWCDDCDDKALDALIRWEDSGKPRYPGSVPDRVQWYNEQLKLKATQKKGKVQMKVEKLNKRVLRASFTLDELLDLVKDAISKASKVRISDDDDWTIEYEITGDKDSELSDVFLSVNIREY